MPEMTSMLQSLGSPEALLAMLGDSGGAGLAPVVAFDAREAGPAEWVIREWFVEGFAPYREYCAWATGIYANIPQLFGLRAEVTKEACACGGARLVTACTGSPTTSGHADCFGHFRC
jgi:hypothetical protein